MQNDYLLYKRFSDGKVLQNLATQTKLGFFVVVFLTICQYQSSYNFVPKSVAQLSDDHF